MLGVDWGGREGGRREKEGGGEGEGGNEGGRGERDGGREG